MPSGYGFKSITVKKGFVAVPPPPAENQPPLPIEPAPPLPNEPPPPLPPSVKKPFSFKMGTSSESQEEVARKTMPANQGLSFGVGKKKGAGVMQFGVKSRPIKTAASAFMESDSEEEEEQDELPKEDEGVGEDTNLPSTPTQQQDTLKKVIEYADTLKLREALRPKLLIRFVKGTEMGGVLPGTLPTPEKDKINTEPCDSKRESKVKKRESDQKSKGGSHNRKEFSIRQGESRDKRLETHECRSSKNYKECLSKKKDLHDSRREFRERWENKPRSKASKEPYS